MSEAELRKLREMEQAIAAEQRCYAYMAQAMAFAREGNFKRALRFVARAERVSAGIAAIWPLIAVMRGLRAWLEARSC